MAALTQEQWDTLYRAVVLDLSALGDLHKCLEQGASTEAQEYRERFETDWALLDAIGWDPEHPKLDPKVEKKALRAVRHLEREAAGCLVVTAKDLRKPRHPMDSDDSKDWLREWADENLDLQAICRQILKESD